MDLNKSDVKDIVNKEIKAFIANEFTKELKKQLSDVNNPARKEVANAIKNAILELSKFLWMQKNTYINNIR
jgi:hypothetical protein